MIRSLCHDKPTLLSAAVLWTLVACDPQQEPLEGLDEDEAAEASALPDEPDDEHDDDRDESATELDALGPSEDLQALPEELAAFGQCLNADCETECACDLLRCEIECIPDGTNPNLCFEYCSSQYNNCVSACP